MITAEAIDSIEFYKNNYFGRVVCLSKENNYVLMLETAWDRYLMKIYDPEIGEDSEVISGTRHLSDTKLAEWRRLDTSSKCCMQEIISALNYTAEKYRKHDYNLSLSSEDYDRIVKVITEGSRPQWERCENEVIPGPIPHPDVNCGMEGPPQPKGALI